MPIYHRTYSPGELQFITTSTYRRTPVFLSPRLSHFRLWNRRFHPFNVYTEEKRREKLNYMHHNPVKRGLVSSPGDWLWSSWRFYFLHDASVLRMDWLH
jgi:REP element-mobilizing transposase RayT